MMTGTSCRAPRGLSELAVTGTRRAVRAWAACPRRPGGLEIRGARAPGNHGRRVTARSRARTGSPVAGGTALCARRPEAAPALLSHNNMCRSDGTSRARRAREGASAGREEQAMTEQPVSGMVAQTAGGMVGQAPGTAGHAPGELPAGHAAALATILPRPPGVVGGRHGHHDRLHHRRLCDGSHPDLVAVRTAAGIAAVGLGIGAVAKITETGTNPPRRGRYLGPGVSPPPVTLGFRDECYARRSSRGRRLGRLFRRAGGPLPHLLDGGGRPQPR